MALSIYGDGLPSIMLVAPPEGGVDEAEAYGGEFGQEGIPRCGIYSVGVKLADFTNRSAMMILPT